MIAPSNPTQRKAGINAVPNGGYAPPTGPDCGMVNNAVKGLTFYALSSGAAAVVAPPSAPITGPVGIVLGVLAGVLDYGMNLAGCK